MKHFASRFGIIGGSFVVIFLMLIVLGLSAIPFRPSSFEAAKQTSTAFSNNLHEIRITSPANEGNLFTGASVAADTLKSTRTVEPIYRLLNTATRTVQASATSEPGTATVPAPSLTGGFAPDEVLIRVNPSAPQDEIQQCLKSSSASIKYRIAKLNVVEVKVPVGFVTEAISRLSTCPGIQYAEPNYDVSIADIIPDDPGWGNQYGLLAIHAPQGWSLSTGSPTVTIAIIDTGVDLTHVDLAGKIVPGFDFVNNDTNVQDNNGHGTHVAGIAAAIANNGIGIAGVSWGARIMPVKVLDASGNGSFANVAAGIVWAVDHGAEVINLSLGGNTPSSVLEDAVNYAYMNGLTLVAASGNSGTNDVLYPARYPQVIAVAATDRFNNRASFSNFGPEIDVAAPGVTIYSTMTGSNYGYMSGTSMATAFVTGLSAILKGLTVRASPDEIAQVIETNALDLGMPGRDDLFGYGLIQMDRAIQADLQSLTPTVVPTNTPTFTPTSTFPVNRTTPVPVAAQVLPETGFIPNRRTLLPAQPFGKGYSGLGDIWLEIPRLGVNVTIVGVPFAENGWDVSWLGDQAGWLNETAFPTHSGNSVISAHVYDAYGNPGPFAQLGELRWGDQIIIHAFGQESVYSVRESELVAPQAVSSVIRHEDLPWLTLITCRGYDETSNTYRYRVVVKAALVEVK